MGSGLLKNFELKVSLHFIQDSGFTFWYVVGSIGTLN